MGQDSGKCRFLQKYCECCKEKLRANLQYFLCTCITKISKNLFKMSVSLIESMLTAYLFVIKCCLI